MLPDIRRAALNYLARREHSKKELYRKLTLKKFNPTDIEIVLNDLLQSKLLNEARFVENYIYFRLKKGFGPLRIQAELLDKGISLQMIDHHLNISDNVWFAEIQRVWQKKFKNKKPKDYKTRAQHMRFLQFRGFTNEQIESVFG